MCTEHVSRKLYSTVLNSKCDYKVFDILILISQTTNTFFHNKIFEINVAL